MNRREWQVLLSLGVSLFESIVAIPRVIILVHGTWAQKESWHMPGGVFFDALESAIEGQEASLVSFLWSGGLGHDDRFHGAIALSQLIKSYPRDTEFVIIAHSHGSNVVVLASQLLAEEPKNRDRITYFFALGTPVRERYQPNMRVIKYLYNLFSFDDLVQTVFGTAQREFVPHKRIANLCITIDGQPPHHSGLHSDIVARWILSLPSIVKTDYFLSPGVVHFAQHNPPRYEKDFKRDVELLEDKRINRMVAAVLHSYVPDAQPDQESHLPGDMHQLLQMTSLVQSPH